MPQEVQLPDGRILVVPDNITLDQRAALRNKLGSQYADIKTGKGMEARAQGQAKESLSSRVGQQEGDDAKFASDINLKPTNVNALTNTLASATGAGLGARALTSRIAPRILRGPGSVGDVSVNPATMAQRELESRVPRNEPPDARNEMYGDLGDRLQRRGTEQAQLDKAAIQPVPVGKVSEGPGPYTGPRSVPKPVPAQPRLGSPENPGFHSKLPTRMPEPQSTPINESPYANQLKDRIQSQQPVPVNQGPGPYTGPGSVPKGNPTPFPGATSTGMPSMQSPATTQVPPVPTLAARVGQSPGQPRTAVPTGEGPLSSRIIRPGEQVDPMKTQSAGSAAQATEGDLRRLAQAGDKSAELELVRRRLPMGPTDYSKMPLPRGMEPVE